MCARDFFISFEIKCFVYDMTAHLNGIIKSIKTILNGSVNVLCMRIELNESSLMRLNGVWRGFFNSTFR